MPRTTVNGGRDTKACDQCRSAKQKCDKAERDNTCKRCEEYGLACVSAIPAKRRGPPKGYLHLIESLKQQLEAVMGVIISIPDPALQGTLRALSGDALVRRVLDQVTAGAYGPAAIRELAETTSDIGEPTSPEQANAWQLYALKAYSAGSMGSRVDRTQTTESHLLFAVPLTEESPVPNVSVSESPDFGLPRLFSRDVELQTAEDEAWAGLTSHALLPSGEGRWLIPDP